MAYESPIRQYLGQMQTEIENEFMVKVSQTVGWIIDKDELTKALLYDRDQFSKGFKEGSRARWLDCHELLPSDDRDVLIHTIFDTFEVARIDRFDANNYLWLTDEGSFSSHQVKYWMPIPELPKDGEQK